jgi:pimeloyl-ACP methyl ester carboxylesterase
MGRENDLIIHHRAPAGAPAGLPFVLIHGWCCDHQAMAPVAAAFPERTHFLVDLPGRGASPPAPDVSIAGRARAVLAALPDQRMIVVGHSMGGQIALAIGGLGDPRIAGTVLLDPARVMPTDKARAGGPLMAQRLRSQPPADVVRTFARAQQRWPVDMAAFDALVETMASAPAGLAIAEWDAILGFDGPAALAALDVPTLAILIERSVNRIEALHDGSPHIMTGQVAAAGHMLQFEAMDQIEAMVRRWLLVAGLDQPACGA